MEGVAPLETSLYFQVDQYSLTLSARNRVQMKTWSTTAKSRMKDPSMSQKVILSKNLRVLPTTTGSNKKIGTRNTERTWVIKAMSPRVQISRGKCLTLQRLDKTISWEIHMSKEIGAIHWVETKTSTNCLQSSQERGNQMSNTRWQIIQLAKVQVHHQDLEKATCYSRSGSLPISTKHKQCQVSNLAKQI